MLICDQDLNNSTLKLFSEIGNTILKKWSAFEYTEDALPQIACEVLVNARLNEIISSYDVLKLALDPDSSLSAHQIDSTFGDLQQIVYRHSRFYIEVLYWTEGTTAIHDHGFSGAFYLLQGSSINIEYTFNEQEKINHHFGFGMLENTVSEQLTIGSVRPIYSGKKFIHSVFHLQNPTISIVVRTYQDDDAMPQFEYRGNRIRLVQDFSIELAKKIQALKFLLNGNNDAFFTYFKKIFSQSPIDERYWLFRAFYQHICQNKYILEFFGNLCGEKDYTIYQTIREEAIFYKVMSLRSQLKDSELRYFLALLLNISNWEKINTYIDQYCDDPKKGGIDYYLAKLRIFGIEIPNLKNNLKCRYETPSLMDKHNLVTNENSVFHLLSLRME